MGREFLAVGDNRALARVWSLLSDFCWEVSQRQAVSWKRPLGNRGLDFSSKMFMKPINSCLYWPGSFPALDVAL